jgi:hypothetical protein
MADARAEFPGVGPVKRFLVLLLIPELALLLLRLLDLTWRYRETGRRHLERALASKQAPVGAFFHGRTFLLLRFMSRPRNGRWLAMCSKSLDGEGMARIEKRLGFQVVRGSSGRDGLDAVVDMIRIVRRDPGLGSCLAVDGSRGPRGRVQGGVVSVAQRTGAWILPVTAAAKPALIFERTWDRTLLPLPWARIHVVYGEPIEVPPRLAPGDFEEIRADLEQRMTALQAKADELAGFGDPLPVGRRERRN